MAKHLPIKSLCWLDDHRIAAASGRCIEIRDINSGKAIVSSVEIFARPHISHIFPLLNTPDAIISGHRELCMVRTTDTGLEFCHRLELSDRVVAVGIFNEEVLMAVLSHGQVVLFNRTTLEITARYSLEQDFLLLSATFIQQSGQIFLAYGTLFNGIEIFQLDPEASTLRLKLRLVGHEGSVFGLALNKDQTMLASVSDDRTVRLWSLNNLLTKEDRLTATRIMVGHGSRIWCVQWIDNERLVTGAEDSTVKVWSLKGDCLQTLTGHIGQNIWSVACNKEKIISGSDDCSIRLWDLSLLQRSDKIVQHEYVDALLEPKHFALASNDRIITVFADGSINGYNSMIPVGLVSRRAVLKYLESINLLLLGSLTGMLHLQKDSMHVPVDCAFTAHIVFIEAWHSGDDCIVLVQAGNGPICLVSIKWPSNVPSVKKIDFEDTTICCAAKTDDLLAIGTRDGHLVFFSTSNSLSGDTCRRFRVSREAVTSIRKHGTDSFLITDRFGQLIALKYDKSLFYANEPPMELWRHRITKSWLEQVEVLSNGDILVMGFESTEAFVLNFTQNVELMRICIGGAHRFWQLVVEEECFTFGYIRLGKVYTFKGQGRAVSRRILKQPLHAAEIRSCALLDAHHFVTAGEDGRIVLLACADDNNNLVIKDSIHGHRHGIKGLVVVNGRIFVGSSIKEISVWSVSAEMRLHRVCFLESDPLTSPLDARIMDLDAIQFQDETLITAACSDSYVRLFKFKDDALSLLAAEELHQGHCALVSKFLVDKDRLFVVSGGTDGLLVLSEGRSLRALTQIRAHQSGINSLCISKTNLVSTGGDDGRLTIYKVDPNNDCNLELVREEQQAHQSTITGLEWLTSETLISTSCDQRLKVWQIIPKTLRPLSSNFIEVCDVAGLQLLSSEEILIYGAGLQLLPLSLNLGPTLTPK